MAHQTLETELDAGIFTLTLHRPERLNAIVSPMWQELRDAVARANREPDVRVIVLKGAGRAFCAGFDFSAQGDVAQQTERHPDHDDAALDVRHAGPDDAIPHLAPGKVVGDLLRARIDRVEMGHQDLRVGPGQGRL